MQPSKTILLFAAVVMFSGCGAEESDLSATEATSDESVDAVAQPVCGRQGLGSNLKWYTDATTYGNGVWTFKYANPTWCPAPAFNIYYNFGCPLSYNWDTVAVAGLDPFQSRTISFYTGTEMIDYHLQLDFDDEVNENSESDNDLYRICAGCSLP